MTMLRDVAQEIGKAFSFVWEMIKKVVGFVVDLAAGIANNKLVLDTLRLLGDAIALAFGAAASAIAFTITQIQNLAAMLPDILGMLNDIWGKIGEGTRAGMPDPFAKRARGGYVAPGSIVTTGEQHPETLLMHRGGGATVIADGGARAARGGGGGMTFAPVFHFHGRMSPAEAREQARAMMPEFVREMRSQGFLPSGIRR